MCTRSFITTCCARQFFNVVICTGIEDADFIQGFEIYPNPSKGDFTIEFTGNGKEELTLQIINNLGQVVEKERVSQIKGTQKRKLELSEHPPGVYTLLFQGDDFAIARRVVIE